MPLRWNRFGFQRMDDKVKDGLVLSVDWSWSDTQSSLGLCFSFGRTIKAFGHTIKGGMDGQLDIDESSELGVVHTC